jgi:Spy/CpxP family protein refolding chaperone
MDPVTIIAAMNGLGALASVIMKQIDLAKQSGELTPEQEQAINEARAKAFAQPYWKPSPE